jgi:hypothetical protein
MGCVRRKRLRFEGVGDGTGVARFVVPAVRNRRLKENKKRMIRILLIGQDRATASRLGLQCLARGVGVVVAENVCEGVRVLATTPVSLIVADPGRLRLGLREQAALFERVAPGARVAVTLPAEASLETRVALELAGFQVVSAPPSADELLKPLA